MIKINLLVLTALFSSLIYGCSGAQSVVLSEANPPGEIANQLGAIMATIDEAGKGSVTIASYKPTSLENLKFASSKNLILDQVLGHIFPDVFAATCGASEFSACASNSVIRNFNGCSNGAYALTGTVSMVWTGGANCTLASTGQAIQITPNYSVAGNNMSLSETKTGAVGVTLTWASGAGASKVFSYVNDGVNRTLRANGSTLLSLNTRTVTPLTVTGTDRTNRTLSGNAGSIEITNATSGEVCTLRPIGVTWNTINCNCATTGNFTGTCTTMGNFQMTITNCGAATIVYTENGAVASQNLNLDRCVSN